MRCGHVNYSCLSAKLSEPCDISSWEANSLWPFPSHNMRLREIPVAWVMSSQCSDRQKGGTQTSLQSLFVLPLHALIPLSPLTPPGIGSPHQLLLLSLAGCGLCYQRSMERPTRLRVALSSCLQLALSDLQSFLQQVPLWSTIYLVSSACIDPMREPCPL